MPNDSKRDRNPTITLEEELHERAKAWAALHGKDLKEFVEDWLKTETKPLETIHKRIRSDRDRKQS